MSNTIHISTLDELYKGLAAAKGGEVFALAGGDYGSFTLNAKSKFDIDLPNITITSADADDPAIFSRVGMNGASGVSFDGVVFDYTFEPGDPTYLRVFDFINCQDISIRNSVFDGDIAYGTGTAADGFGNAYALSVRGSSNFTVENNEFYNFTRGLIVGSSSGIQIIGNDVHSMRSDGMDFAGVTDVLIEGNYLHDFIKSSASGDHPDMIQFWTNGTKAPTENVVIRGNILDIGDGGWTQSIFMRNEEVDTGRQSFEDMAYRNILIEDNVITNAHSHGITVGEVNGLIIRNNSVLHADGGWDNPTGAAVEIPRILVKSVSTNVTIEGNITSSIAGHDVQADWVVDRNLFVQDNNPNNPGWYGDIFVNSTLQAEDGMHRYILLPDGEAARLGVGASLSHADPGEVAGRFHVAEGATAATRIFDARVSSGGDLPAGTLVEWDFGDGQKGSGLVVDHSYATGGSYVVTMTMQLPDGTVVSRSSPADIRGAQLVEMGDGGFLTYKNGVADLHAALDLADGLQLGASGVTASVGARHIQSLMGASEFAFGMTLTADPAGGAGEVLRIHGGITVSVNSKGEVSAHLWNADGVQTQLLGKGVSIGDGRAHDVSIEVGDGRGLLIIDGEVAAEGAFSGTLRALGARDLSFGNPWGQANFHGDLTDFRITIDGSAYTQVDTPAPEPDPGLTPDPDPAPAPEPELVDPDPSDHGQNDHGMPDPSEPARMQALDLPLPENFASSGMQLGAPGMTARVASRMLGDLLASEEFRIDLTLAADTIGTSGEVFRIHTGIVVSVNAKGELLLRLWNTDGDELRLLTKGASVSDGAAHEVSIEVEAGQARIIVDGEALGEAAFSGTMQMLGVRDLTFGEPWGKPNFHGDLSDFRISIPRGDDASVEVAPEASHQPEPALDGPEFPADHGLNLALDLPEAFAEVGMQLGDPGVVARVPQSQFLDLLAADAFRIDLSLAADIGGGAGEVFRIHTGIVAAVNSKGDFDLRLWNTDGELTRVVATGVDLNDGAQHDVAIRVDGGLAQVFVDGELSGEAAFSGVMQAYGVRDLTFGNPWGQTNFQGELTAFEIMILEDAGQGPAAAPTGAWDVLAAADGFDFVDSHLVEDGILAI